METSYSLEIGRSPVSGCQIFFVFWSAAEKLSSNHFSNSHKTSAVDPLSDDMDSCLAQDDADKEGEGQRSKFNAVIGHIIKLLPKEKLNEAFIEKMCLRFRVVNDSRVQMSPHWLRSLTLALLGPRLPKAARPGLPNYAPCLRHDEGPL